MEHATIKVKFEGRLNVQLKRFRRFFITSNCKGQLLKANSQINRALRHLFMSIQCNIYIPWLQNQVGVELFCTPFSAVFVFIMWPREQTKINTYHPLVFSCFWPCTAKIKSHSNWALLALPEGAWEAVLGETKTGSLDAALMAAISSKRFHVASRFDFMSFPWASSSWYLRMHSSKNSGSVSEKILRTFIVKLWTAWFQWFRAFCSREGKTMGSIILWFCLIRFSMWSLFHKNKALSATCKLTSNH